LRRLFLLETENYLTLRAFPSPEHEAVWRDFLGRAEMPSHYDSPEFFLEPWWEGKRPFAILALHDGKVVGSLTGVHETNRAECGLPTRPQICFDRTADKATVAERLVQGLLAEAGRSLAILYSWDPLPSLEQLGFRTRQGEGSVVLDLTLGPETLMKQFHSNRRRNIRFAIEKGLEVSVLTSERDFEEVYALHCAWQQTSRKKIVAKMASLERFKETWGRPENRRVFLVRLNGKLVAADVVRFQPGGLLEAAANFSLGEYLNLKPNDLVVWKIIEWACQEGFTRLSLGGAHSFLRYFGGTVVPIYRHRVDRTFLRQHDLRDALVDVGRTTLSKAPPPVAGVVRRILGKE
jgi:CelD/BcsL family acetyltransferase involved in cellulose biosynthesis